MSDLASHIAAQNAKTRAWVAEDPENRWAMTTTEDMEWWASIGITTVEQYKLHCAFGAYVDTYKEHNGIKPRWMRAEDHTADEWWQMVDDLYAAQKAEEEREAAEKARVEAAYAATREEPEALTYNPFAKLVLK